MFPYYQIMKSYNNKARFAHFNFRYFWPNGWTELADIFEGTHGYPQGGHRLKNYGTYGQRRALQLKS